MKGGIKYSNLRQIRMKISQNDDPFQVGRIVQGSERNEIAYGIDHLLCDQCGLVESRTAMDNSMSDSIKFIDGDDGSGTMEHGEEKVESLMVVGYPLFLCEILVSTADFPMALLFTDTLHQRRCHTFAIDKVLTFYR